MTYTELTEKQQKEVEDFPIFYAFNQKQFEEGMRSLGLDPTDTNRICKVGNTGGYIRKEDAIRLHEMLNRHAQEVEEQVKADTTGEGFIRDMFRTELANREYSYTKDVTDTLDALGLTRKDVDADPALRKGLALAIRDLR